MPTKTPSYLKDHVALYARAPHVAAQRDLVDHTAAKRCNLLLNTGPLADGSVHPEVA